MNELGTLLRFDMQGRDAIRRAIVQGDAPSIYSLVEKGVPVDHADGDGGTPLMLAATIAGSPQNTAVMQALIERGAAINAQDKFGFSPVAYTAIYHRLENLALLIDHDARVDLKLKNGGQTPLELMKENLTQEKACAADRIISAEILAQARTNRLNKNLPDEEILKKYRSQYPQGRESRKKILLALPDDQIPDPDFIKYRQNNLQIQTLLVEAASHKVVRMPLHESVSKTRAKAAAAGADGDFEQRKER